MAATNPEISPMTPPPSPTTNELRSSPAAIISSQIFSTCASDFDFSPDGIRTNRGEKFSELKLSQTRSLNNRAEISSTITAQHFPLTTLRVSSPAFAINPWPRSEEHTSELQSQFHLVCRLLLEKKKKNKHH